MTQSNVHVATPGCQGELTYAELSQAPVGTADVILALARTAAAVGSAGNPHEVQWGVAAKPTAAAVRASVKVTATICLQAPSAACHQLHPKQETVAGMPASLSEA